MTQRNCKMSVLLSWTIIRKILLRYKWLLVYKAQQTVLRHCLISQGFLISVRKRDQRYRQIMQQCVLKAKIRLPVIIFYQTETMILSFQEHSH